MSFSLFRSASHPKCNSWSEMPSSSSDGWKMVCGVTASMMINDDCGCLLEAVASVVAHSSLHMSFPWFHWIFNFLHSMKIQHCMGRCAKRGKQHWAPQSVKGASHRVRNNQLKINEEKKKGETCLCLHTGKFLFLCSHNVMCTKFGSQNWDWQ